MFNIDLLMEAIADDRNTYREVSNFLKNNKVKIDDENKTEKEIEDFYAQLRAQAANKPGNVADARNVKRVSDDARIGKLTTLGDIAARYEAAKDSKATIALACLNVERALQLQNDKGRDINAANLKPNFMKALSGLYGAIESGKKTGALNSTQYNILREYIKDCKTQLDLNDETERMQYTRDLVQNMARWGLGKYINKKELVTPENTPTGPARAAWLANTHAHENIDHRSVELKKSDKDMENKSYGDMKMIADKSEKLRKLIRSGKVPEGTTIADLIKYDNEKIAAKDGKVPVKNQNLTQAIATKAKLNELHIPTMADRPVEGCKNVKELVKKWKSEGKQPAGQIEIAYRPAKKADGAGVNEVQTKPIVYIFGNYYQVPQNDLFTSAKGGIAVSDSEFVGYTKKNYNDPKHADLRAKLKVRNASVDTEYFNY